MAKSSRIVLPPEHVAGLHQSQRELTDLLPELDKAEECGIDCQLYRQSLQEALEQANNLLKNFGPGITSKR